MRTKSFDLEALGRALCKSWLWSDVAICGLGSDRWSTLKIVGTGLGNNRPSEPCSKPWSQLHCKPWSHPHTKPFWSSRQGRASYDRMMIHLLWLAIERSEARWIIDLCEARWIIDGRSACEACVRIAKHPIPSTQSTQTPCHFRGLHLVMTFWSHFRLQDTRVVL